MALLGAINSVANATQLLLLSSWANEKKTCTKVAFDPTKAIIEPTKT